MKEGSIHRKNNENTDQTCNFSSSFFSSAEHSYSTVELCLNKIEELKHVFYETLHQRKDLSIKNQHLKKKLAQAKETVDMLLRNKSSIASPRPGSIVRLKGKKNYNFANELSLQSISDNPSEVRYKSSQFNDSFHSVLHKENQGKKFSLKKRNDSDNKYSKFSSRDKTINELKVLLDDGKGERKHKRGKGSTDFVMEMKGNMQLESGRNSTMSSPRISYLRK